MSKEGYTPLTEANTNRIRTDVNLPYRLENQIGLDLQITELLCQISGFSSLRIANSPYHNRSRRYGAIGSVQNDGSVTGVGAFYSDDEEANSEIGNSRFKGIYMKRSRWADLSILIDIEEMKGKLMERGMKVSDTQEWSRSINKVVKQSIVKKGTEHLLKMEINEKIQVALTYMPTLAYVSYEIITNPSYEPIQGILKQAIYLMIASLIIPTVMDGPERPREGSRLSLLFAPEIDRAIALHVVALGRSLIAPVNQK